MPVANRSTHTVSIKAQSTGNDSYGGKAESAGSTLDTGYDVHIFTVTPFDREKMITQYGLDEKAVVRKAYGVSNSNATVGVIFENESDATERYEVVGKSPMGGRDGSEHHVTYILLQEKN